MTTTWNRDEAIPPVKTVSGWVGWIMFAAFFMIIGGVLDVLQGLAGILRDQSYFAVGDNRLLVLDYTSWGWIHLVFGLALIGVGVLLLRGSGFARIVGIGLVGLNMVAQFAWVAAYPVWAILVIAIDALVIFALIVHGRDLHV